MAITIKEKLEAIAYILADITTNSIDQEITITFGIDDNEFTLNELNEEIESIKGHMLDERLMCTADRFRNRVTFKITAPNE